MEGITLIEVLILFLIIAILASFISFGFDFYKRQELENQARAVLQTLRRAQIKAMAIELDSDFGVHLTNNNYILFKGNSYLSRDSQYDEVFDFPIVINVSGLSEIVFLKSEGIPKENPAYCGGECTPCDQFINKPSCLAQDGCLWDAKLKKCTGTCTPCDSYQNQADCENQSGCIWYPASRGGNIILRINGESRTININEVGRINLQL